MKIDTKIIPWDYAIIKRKDFEFGRIEYSVSLYNSIGNQIFHGIFLEVEFTQLPKIKKERG